MMTNDKAKIVAKIILAADEIETKCVKGGLFEDTVMQYCKALDVTREDVEQLMDTKLREIIARA